MQDPVLAKPVIGVIGGIGSGKTHVARLLAQRGGYLIQADLLGHEALRQEDIRQAVVQHWGREVLAADGQVDRPRLARIVFADPCQRQRLEQLVFPWIERRMREELAKAHEDGRVRFVVLDAAILLESGWHRLCQRIVFVDAPRPVRLARLAATRGWDEKEVEAREQAQLPLEHKKARAHVVVHNDGTAASDQVLARQLDQVVQELLASQPPSALVPETAGTVASGSSHAQDRLELS